MSEQSFYSELSRLVASGEISARKELEQAKKRLCRKHGVKKIPTSADIAARLGPSELLLTKPVRSLSGVSAVAIMTKPAKCPGTCIYCPSGSAAKSYTGHEPAAMRARQMGFGAARQAHNRISQLTATGHPTSKIELIVMGGTFTALPLGYQKDFVLGAFNAMNGTRTTSMREAHSLNEKARHRCIGMTFELRPDYCKESDIRRILSYGGTRVELGVQTIYDGVYRKVKRGHTVKDAVDATRLLKDSGFKVAYHVMPGLPYSTEAMDLKMFKSLFSDSRFMPDMLKIYPCLLPKREFAGDEIYSLYESGKWSPIGNEDAARLLTRARRHFPEWVRVMRIQRDIPSNLIEAGVTASNLRELLKGKCRCIRCREIRAKKVEKPELRHTEYLASKGKEHFIQLADSGDSLYGFVRLREPHEPFIPVLEGAALVRELHVYGKEARLGEKGSVQHRGLGKLLLSEAESAARGRGYGKIAVISGVGARPYYRELGYSLKGGYMVKGL